MSVCEKPDKMHCCASTEHRAEQELDLVLENSVRGLEVTEQLPGHS